MLCSGKVGVDLDSSPLRDEAAAVAVARLEQLAPFPDEALSDMLDRYPNLEEVVWLQEEPRNMGAWTYIEPRLRDLLQVKERPLPLATSAGRSGPPAEGSASATRRAGADRARRACGGARAIVSANGRRRSEAKSERGSQERRTDEGSRRRSGIAVAMLAWNGPGRRRSSRMPVEIRVPPLGESLVDAVVGAWLKRRATPSAGARPWSSWRPTRSTST